MSVCILNANVIPIVLAQSSEEDINFLYFEGLEAYEQGMYEQAIDYFERVLAIEPYNVPSLVGKGLALSDSGYYQEAIEYYDRALTVDPHILLKIIVI